MGSQQLTPMRVVGYIRVSSAQQRKEGLSVGVQEQKIREFANLRDAEVVEITRDEGRSGGKIGRPGLQSALSVLESGKADTLVTTKLDRLTRSLRDFLWLIEDYFGPDRPYELVTIFDSMDTTTVHGRLVCNIMMVLAQAEREQAAERTKVVRDAKRERGEYLGGNVPFGFRAVKPRHGKKRLEADPSEQMTVDTIREMRAEGYTYGEIAATLNDEGHDNRGRAWTRFSVRKVCK